MIPWRRNHDETPRKLDLSLFTTGPTQDRHPFPPEVILYDQDDVHKFSEEANLAKDVEACAASAKVLRALKERGQVRLLMTMSPSFRSNLKQLRDDFPNFAEVVDYLHCCAEIGYRQDKVLRFTPILLDGEGGVGKTLFAETLSNFLGQPFHRVSVSSSQNGSDLAGSSAFFSNAKPGIPFTALVFGDYANPVIFLDEIDKNTTSTYDALGALYVLLEPKTAKTYKDQCYPLSIRADSILFVAASNDAERLHPALRSRFREFKIGLTAEQARKIAQKIISSTIAELTPAADGISFSTTAMEALERLTPRKISQTVLEAIGKAFRDGVSEIQDIPCTDVKKRQIGFV